MTCVDEYTLTYIQCDQKKSPNVYKQLLPKALKTCPKFDKSPNLVTLHTSNCLLASNQAQLKELNQGQIDKMHMKFSICNKCCSQK